MNERDELPAEPKNPTTSDEPLAAAATPADDGDQPFPADVPVTPGAAAEDAESDLPEWEPLTPELVEDEAIRGDVMLRWAVILLALLMGWTIIQDTAVLTHVKSGETIAANGFFPPRTDPLSSSTSGMTWVNLAWLWDVTVAGVHAVLGGAGLSLLTAVLAATTFWLLSRISLPEVSNWWGSVCGLLALVAAFPSLSATPAIVTLLGTVTVLWLLPLGQARAGRQSSWPIVGVLILWNQLDDRAWIGLAVLLVFALGDWWDSRSPSESKTERATPLWRVAALSVVAFLAHPFLWETLVSAVDRYRLDYPALQAYAHRGVPFFYERFPVWDERFWDVSYFNGAGLLLWLATVITLVLNAAHLRVSHLLLMACSTGLMVCGGGELAVVGLIHAVIATVNAQEWYRASFRQTYSIEPAELLFSRGGRAVTVMGFFAVGLAMVSGHLTGADGRRVGMGFDRALRQEIDSYADVLAVAFDNRPFNLRPEQGDVLNWIGQRPFIDSRLRLFAQGTPSLLSEHLAARASLRAPRTAAAPSGGELAWKGTFDRHNLTHVLPRLSGDTPDYVTFADLMNSPDWTLTRLGAATATFYRSDVDDPQLTAFLEEHRLPGVIETELQSREEDLLVDAGRLTWPRPPSIYERSVYLPQTATPNALQLARHYLTLGESQSNTATIGEVIAISYAAIRRVHEGLVDSPNDRRGYHILGQSYETLWNIEQDLMQRSGLEYPGFLRYFQTISAYHHALACDPEDAIAQYQLFRIYMEQQRQDLGERHLLRFRELTGRLSLLPETDPNSAAVQQQLADSLVTMSAAVAEARQKLQDDLAAGADRVLLAQRIAQAGFPLLALETLEGDLTAVSGNPVAAQMYGRLLLETGRTSEAYDQLQAVKRLAEQQPQAGDWSSDVAIGEVIAEDLRGALATLAEEAKRLETSSTAVLLQAVPFTATGPAADGSLEVSPLIPVAQRIQMVSAYYDQLLPRLEITALRLALIELELGENGAASERLLNVLKQDPLSSVRPLAENYVKLLSPEAEVPPLPDMEAELTPLDDLFPPTVENDTPADAKTSDEAASSSDAKAPEVNPPAASDNAATNPVD